MLSDRQTYRIKIHVLDHQFLSKLFCKKGCQFHIDPVIIIALCIFKGFKSRIGSYHKLILGSIQLCRLHCFRLAVAEILVADLVKGAVLQDLCDKCVRLLQKFRLIFVHAECIFFIRQINIDHLGCRCSAFCAILSFL